MTGAEVAAGAMAVGAGKVAAEVVREEVSVTKDIRRLASNNAGMQAAASAYGRRQAVKQELLLNLFRPLASLVGISKAYFDGQFGEDLAVKMADVPDEETTTPRASIAGPAMQGLGFSLDEPALKDMYLELLARASDGRTIEGAHPSFVDVIRQLTSREATYLKLYLSGPSQTVMRIAMVYAPSGSTVVRADHISDLRNEDGSFIADEHFSTYVDNWIRLGLVTCDYTFHLAREGAYDWVEQHPLYRTGVQEAKIINEHGGLRAGDTAVSCIPEKGIIERTSFGAQFAQIVGLGEVGITGADAVDDAEVD